MNLTAQNPCPCAPILFDWSGFMGKKRVFHNYRTTNYRTLQHEKPAKLTNLDTFPDFRRDSEFVYKTVALGLGSRAGACVTSTHLLAPLRQIVARTPISVPIAEPYSTVYYLDTLSCGHQVCVYPQTGEVNQKRHRCPECKEAQLALKFPPASVTSSRKKGAA